MQEAKYRNRKKGMETGRTEEEKALEEPPTGENGKKGKERTEGQVVRTEQKRTKESRKRGKSPKARAKGKHRWNSCGSEAGRDERKQTESRVRRTGKEDTGN